MSSLPVSPVLLRATLRGHTSACFVGLVVKRRSLLTSKLLHLCGNKKKNTDSCQYSVFWGEKQHILFCVSMQDLQLLTPDDYYEMLLR